MDKIIGFLFLLIIPFISFAQAGREVKTLPFGIPDSNSVFIGQQDVAGTFSLGKNYKAADLKAFILSGSSGSGTIDSILGFNGNGFLWNVISPSGPHTTLKLSTNFTGLVQSASVGFGINGLSQADSNIIFSTLGYRPIDTLYAGSGMIGNLQKLYSKQTFGVDSTKVPYWQDTNTHKIVTNTYLQSQLGSSLNFNQVLNNGDSTVVPAKWYNNGRLIAFLGPNTLGGTYNGDLRLRDSTRSSGPDSGLYFSAFHAFADGDRVQLHMIWGPSNSPFGKQIAFQVDSNLATIQVEGKGTGVSGHITWTEMDSDRFFYHNSNLGSNSIYCSNTSSTAYRDTLRPISGTIAFLSDIPSGSGITSITSSNASITVSGATTVNIVSANTPKLSTPRSIGGNFGFDGTGDLNFSQMVLNGATSGTINELPPATITSYVWSPPSSVAATTGMVLQVASISSNSMTTTWATPSAGLSYAFTGGVTNTAGTVTNDLITPTAGSKTIIGGTGATDQLNFKSTTGNKTSGFEYTWTGGNNGSNTLLALHSNGDFYVPGQVRTNAIYADQNPLEIYGWSGNGGFVLFRNFGFQVGDIDLSAGMVMNWLDGGGGENVGFTKVNSTTVGVELGGVLGDSSGTLALAIERISSLKTSVGGSTSGSASFSMPQQGTSRKLVTIHCTALLGTASYTFPTAFTNTPSVIYTNTISSGIVTALTTTSITLTGVTTTGYLEIVEQN